VDVDLDVRFMMHLHRGVGSDHGNEPHVSSHQDRHASAALVLKDISYHDIVRPVLEQAGVRSILGVALICLDRPLGDLHVATPSPHDFGPEEVVAELTCIPPDHGHRCAAHGARLPRRPAPTRNETALGFTSAGTSLHRRAGGTVRRRRGGTRERRQAAHSERAAEAFRDATLLFLIQVLLTRHPDLLAAHNDNDDTHSPEFPLRAARHILLAVREVHYALDRYRTLFPDEPRFVSGARADDEILF
jgi:hypothetical protein